METISAKPEFRGFFLKNYLHTIIFLVLSTAWLAIVSAGMAKVDALVAWVPLLLCIAYVGFAAAHSHLYCKVTTIKANADALTFETGILNHLRKKVAVHNIADTAIDTPFYDRIIGVSTIRISTSGSTGYEIEVGGVPTCVAREFHASLYRIILHVRKEFGNRAPPAGGKDGKPGGTDAV